jgi:hypothetical protein
MAGWTSKPVRVLLAVALGVTVVTLGAQPSGAARSPGHGPVPVFSAAYGVSCTGPAFCVAVGGYNANDVVHVLTEVWRGAGWAVVPSPDPAGAVQSQLNGVSCMTPARCYAVGSYTDSNSLSWPFAESWDGSAWTLVPVPTPAGGSFGGLSGVSCVSTVFCFAVGSLDNRRSVTVPLAERWDGSAWSVVHSPRLAGASSGLNSVACTGEAACMAVGSGIDAASARVTLAEKWNGTAWSIVASPDPTGAQGSNLNSVSCPVSSRCVAVGNYFDSDFMNVTLIESWDGSSWSIDSHPNPDGSYDSSFAGVSCANASHCLAVGHTYSPSFAAKDDTLAEAWNGSAWSTVSSPSPSTTSGLNAVSCVHVASCMAVGSFFNSSNDYQTLAERWNGSSLSIVNQDAELAGVSCLDATHCVAVGSHFAANSLSTTLAVVSDGNGWRVVPTPNPASSEGSYLSAVTCLTAARCVAVGYYYDSDNTRLTLVEAWNGQHWSIVPSPNPDGSAYSVFYGVACTSATQCTAVGSSGGRTLAESWDGTHWSIAPTGDPLSTAYSELNSVTCRSATRCLAVGYETDTLYHADLTLAERWNGSTWSMVPSAAPGKRNFQSSVLHGVSCSSAGGCLAVGYRQNESGTFGVLTERWTGQKWVVQSSPTLAGSVYSNLSAISCTTTGQCVAVGNYFNHSGEFLPLNERWTGSAWHVLPTLHSNTSQWAIAYFEGVSCVTSTACVGVGTSGNPADLAPLAQVWDGSSWASIRLG